MGLDMLLQVLRPLEGLATEVTLVRLERHMDANVRGDVVAFDGGGTAGTPLTSQVQVVGALAADMTLTDVFLNRRPMSATSATVGSITNQADRE